MILSRSVDRLGLGDTRIEFGVHALENQWCDMVISLYATLPTAFSIVKGLAGSTFDAPSTYPSVDFNVLYDTAEAIINNTVTPAQQAASFLVIQNFLIDAWKRIDAALLDNGLGNESHPGLGICLTADAQLDRWIKKSWAIVRIGIIASHLNILFKNDNTRFYINKNDPENFNRDFRIPDPAVAQANLDFLQNEFIYRALHAWSFNQSSTRRHWYVEKRNHL